MANQINIVVGAEVNGALQGLQQVQQQSQRTFQGVNQSSGAATQSLVNLSRVAQDAPFGFIGIANNLNPLIESFQRLKATTGTNAGALKALGGALAGPAGLGLAVGVASSLMVVFGDKLFGASKAAEKAKTDADKLKESITGIYTATGKEASNAAGLVAILQSETETRNRKLSAIKELQQIQPEIFKGLKLEGEAVVGLDSAYQKYLGNLQTVIAAKIKQAQLDQAFEKLLKLQGVTLTAEEKRYKDLADAIGQANQAQISGSVAGAQLADKQRKQTEKQTNEVKLLQTEIQNLSKDLIELSKGIEVREIPAPKINLDIPLLAIVEFNDKIIKEFQKSTVKLQQGLGLYTKTFDKEYLQKVQDVLNKKPVQIAFAPIDAKSAIAQLQLARQIRFLEDLFFEAKKQINNAIEGIQIDALASLGEGIGRALTGGGLRDVFKGFIDTIAGGVVAIGKQMIALGIKAALLKKALSSLFSNPIALVAAGVGLVAVGSAIRGALSKGIEGREKGGPVAGNTAYLVGERGPELFVPSVGGSIIPNNRLGAFNGRPAFAAAMGGRSIVRGTDILLASARSQRSINRVNA